MKPTIPPGAYRVFLVTVWQEQNLDKELAERWRFRLEDPHTNQKRVFANPQALIVALKEGVLAPSPQIES
jgi:hypothetical protein